MKAYKMLDNDWSCVTMEKPRKKDDWIVPGKIDRDAKNYNIAIKEYNLWLKEKCEGLERIFKNHYWDSLEKDRGIIEKHCAFLVGEIRKYLGVE